ncbi:MAG: hypothetical protein M3228_15605 [Actinomycetota bacterium]|nr:hypothetical protein [Actinomycetota bacterium]
MAAGEALGRQSRTDCPVLGPIEVVEASVVEASVAWPGAMQRRQRQQRPEPCASTPPCRV